MPRTGNIEYIVDDRGRKKSVVMSYRAYMQLMEDIADLRTIAERSKETPISLDDVIADFKNAGRI
jgi:hypothetical protein